jgi:TolA-binding protein
VVLVAVFAVGCGQKEQAANEGKATSDQVTQEVKESAEAAKTYTQEHKDQYLADMEEQLKQYQIKIDQLKKKAELAEEDSKASLEENVQKLEKQQQVAKERLAELKGSSEKAWTDLMTGTDAAMSELKKTYESIVAEY